MRAKLYEPCTLCDGTGTPRPDARVVIEPADRARVADQFRRGICPGCQGRRYLETGLTADQVERMVAELAQLRELTGATADDLIWPAVAELGDRVATLRVALRETRDRTEAAERERDALLGLLIQPEMEQTWGGDLVPTGQWLAMAPEDLLGEVYPTRAAAEAAVLGAVGAAKGLADSGESRGEDHG